MSETYTVYYTELEDGTTLAASEKPCFCVSGKTQDEARERVGEILSFHERRHSAGAIKPVSLATKLTRTVRPFAPSHVEHRTAGVCVPA